MFASRWLQAGTGWFTSFSTKPTPRNPFDVAAPKDAAASQPHAGYVWAHQVTCTSTVRADGVSEITVRAAITAFHEGKTWTAPIKDGVLLLLTVTAKDDGVDLTAAGMDRTMFLPEAVLRQPARAEIPARNSKRGIPCGEKEVWHRARCRAEPVPDKSRRP